MLPMALPENLEQAAALLRRSPIPDALRDVARILHDAGHEVVLVGGAVRDVLLARPHGDWDLATSATPDEVQRLFKKTIPTGVAHGTITVVHGRGKDRIHTEVTTFRGEGKYDDGRRPSEVRFLRELREDLARRDFTINAFAYNPITEVLTDAFDGLSDLRRGVIRAVGEPAQRFQEDGLRAMRAVRLCAVLEYRLDPATAAAIAGALDVLMKVSGERIHVELWKLLASPRPLLGLEPMVDTGIWDRVLAPMPREEILAAIEHVERLPRDPVIRLARLLWPLRDDRGAIEAIIERLKPSRDERARVVALTDPQLAPLATLRDPAQIRRLLAAVGRKYAADAAALHAREWAQAVTIEDAVRGAPLAASELAIGGRDLVDAGLATPGPAMGRTLAGLLDWVLDDPRRNTAELLLARVREQTSAG